MFLMIYLPLIFRHITTPFNRFKFMLNKMANNLHLPNHIQKLLTQRHA